MAVPDLRLTWWPLLHSVIPRNAIGQPFWLLHFGHTNPFGCRTRNKYSAQASSVGNMRTKSSRDFGLSILGNGWVILVFYHVLVTWVNQIGKPSKSKNQFPSEIFPGTSLPSQNSLNSCIRFFLRCFLMVFWNVFILDIRAKFCCLSGKFLRWKR